MTKGLFITLEGGEGVGKSTQLVLLERALQARGLDILVTREPGGSPVAEDLRNLLLFGQHSFSRRSEILTHFAARFDHVDQVIEPALAAGKLVVCDRFTDSTLAYQAYGRAEGEVGTLSLINNLQKQLGRQPDMTFLLEVSRDTARRRLAARGKPTDRYEKSDEDFHIRVAEGFRTIAEQNKNRVIVLSTEHMPAEKVNAVIVEHILSRLP